MTINVTVSPRSTSTSGTLTFNGSSHGEVAFQRRGAFSISCNLIKLIKQIVQIITDKIYFERVLVSTGDKPFYALIDKSKIKHIPLEEIFAKQVTDQFYKHETQNSKYAGIKLEKDQAYNTFENGYRMYREGFRGKLSCRGPCGLDRNIFITDKTIYIHLNKKKCGDVVVGEGASDKKIKYSLGSDGFIYTITTRRENNKIGKFILSRGLEKECEIWDQLKDKKDAKKYVLAAIHTTTTHSIKRKLAKLYRITKFCSEKCLFEFLKNNDNIKLDEKYDIALQMGNPIKFFHDNGYIHRDIKTENFFVDRDIDGKLTIVIGDYDSAINISKLASADRSGTPEFMAPETLQKRPIYSKASDVYSFGCSLHEIFIGTLPHTLAKDLSGNVIEFKTPEMVMKEVKKMSKDWMDKPTDEDSIEFLIYQMVHIDRSKRISMKEVLERLAVLKTNAVLEND